MAARRGPLRLWSPPWPAVEGPAPASSGSSAAACWFPGAGTGLDGRWLGPRRRAAVEVPESSCALVPSELSGPAAGVPSDAAAWLGTAAGLPSGLPAAREAPRPSRFWASPLQRCTAVAMSRCTKPAVCLPRDVRSSTVRAASFRPKKRSLEMTCCCAAEAALLSCRKSRLSSWRSHGSRGWSIAGCRRKRDAQIWGWRLPTGSLCTGPAACGRKTWCAGAVPGCWALADVPAGGAMTSSSKLLSALTECRMERILLLQRGHRGVVSAHRWMQTKQKRWRHGTT